MSRRMFKTDSAVNNIFPPSPTSQFDDFLRSSTPASKRSNQPWANQHRSQLDLGFQRNDPLAAPQLGQGDMGRPRYASSNSMNSPVSASSAWSLNRFDSLRANQERSRGQMGLLMGMGNPSAKFEAESSYGRVHGQSQRFGGSGQGQFQGHGPLSPPGMGSRSPRIPSSLYGPSGMSQMYDGSQKDLNLNSWKSPPAEDLKRLGLRRESAAAVSGSNSPRGQGQSQSQNQRRISQVPGLESLDHMNMSKFGGGQGQQGQGQGQRSRSMAAGNSASSRYNREAQLSVPSHIIRNSPVIPSSSSAASGGRQFNPGPSAASQHSLGSNQNQNQNQSGHQLSSSIMERSRPNSMRDQGGPPYLPPSMAEHSQSRISPRHQAAPPGHSGPRSASRSEERTIQEIQEREEILKNILDKHPDFKQGGFPGSPHQIYPGQGQSQGQNPGFAAVDGRGDSNGPTPSRPDRAKRMFFGTELEDDGSECVSSYQASFGNSNSNSSMENQAMKSRGIRSRPSAGQLVPGVQKSLYQKDFDWVNRAKIDKTVAAGQWSGQQGQPGLDLGGHPMSKMDRMSSYMQDFTGKEVIPLMPSTPNSGPSGSGGHQGHESRSGHYGAPTLSHPSARLSIPEVEHELKLQKELENIRQSYK